MLRFLCGHRGTGMNAYVVLALSVTGWINSCGVMFASVWRHGVSGPTHQALALLAVLHPRVPAAVGEQAVLVQALAAQPGVALGAAEQVGVGVVAVANHPAAHHLAGLSRGEQKHLYHMSTNKR